MSVLESVRPFRNHRWLVPVEAVRRCFGPSCEVVGVYPCRVVLQLHSFVEVLILLIFLVQDVGKVLVGRFALIYFR